MEKNKSYKYAIISALITLFIFSAAIYTSCKKDCAATKCLNGGSCNNDKCVCPTYFSGNNCEINNDPCRSVTCQNGGACAGGTCSCPVGSTGTFCEKVYRNSYNNTYIGNGTCTKGYTYWKSKLNFSNNGKTLTSMNLDVIIDSSIGIPNWATFQVTLTDFNASGTSFILPTITRNTFVEGIRTLSGTGTITDSTASFLLTEIRPTDTVFYRFESFRK